MGKIHHYLALLFIVMLVCVSCGNKKTADIEKTHHKYTVKEFLFYHPEFSMWIDETEVHATTPVDEIRGLVGEDVVVTLDVKDNPPDQQKKIYVNNTDLYRFPGSEIYMYIECG